MRYHWGLGVGHLHAHRATPNGNHEIFDPSKNETEAVGSDPLPLSQTSLDLETLWPPAGGDEPGIITTDGIDYESGNPELTLDDCDLDGWEDSVESGCESGADGDDGQNFGSDSENDDCEDIYE
jgi:hypothetical protein